MSDFANPFFSYVFSPAHASPVWADQRLPVSVRAMERWAVYVSKNPQLVAKRGAACAERLRCEKRVCFFLPPWGEIAKSGMDHCARCCRAALCSVLGPGVVCALRAFRSSCGTPRAKLFARLVGPLLLSRANQRRGRESRVRGEIAMRKRGLLLST